MLLRLRQSGRRPLADAVCLNLSRMPDDESSLQNSQQKLSCVFLSLASLRFASRDKMTSRPTKVAFLPLKT